MTRDEAAVEAEQSLVDQIIETGARLRAQTAVPVAEFWFGTRAWDRFLKEAEVVCGYTDPDWPVARIQGIPIVLKPALGPDDVVPMARCPVCLGQGRVTLCQCAGGLVPLRNPS